LDFCPPRRTLVSPNETYHISYGKQIVIRIQNTEYTHCTLHTALNIPSKLSYRISCISLTKVDQSHFTSVHFTSLQLSHSLINSLIHYEAPPTDRPRDDELPAPLSAGIRNVSHRRLSQSPETSEKQKGAGYGGIPAVHGVAVLGVCSCQDVGSFLSGWDHALGSYE